ncbi:MAG: hypothetical protein AB2L07_10840 [Thermoanaerobaculaceae bacterium]
MRQPQLLLTALLFSSVALADPAFKIGRDSVRLGGVSPGGQAVVIVGSHELAGYVLRVGARHFLVTDDDGDGEVEIPISPIPLVAVWGAVDIQTGGSCVAFSPGVLPQPIQVENVELSKAGSGTIRILRQSQVDVAVVRPGSGAWVESLVDGAASDQDGTRDHAITSLPDGFASILVSAPKLQGLASGDVVLLIDAENLQGSSVQVR